VWTPEEVAFALHARRDELLLELRKLPDARGLPVEVLEEVVDDAVSAVVMKPRAILDEEHLRRAFSLSVKLLLARYREGRHRVRVGSWERADFDVVARQAPATDRTVTEEVELRDRMARAADFMAQLDEFERQVMVVMAVRGAGIRATASELGVPLKTVTEWYGVHTLAHLFAGTLLPDAYGVLTLPHRPPLHILLELDRGTETSQILREKAKKVRRDTPPKQPPRSEPVCDPRRTERPSRANRSRCNRQHTSANQSLPYGARKPLDPCSLPLPPPLLKQAQLRPITRR
jgi:DNA-directed RNA polymerase specialized sigma24 family protein